MTRQSLVAVPIVQQPINQMWASHLYGLTMRSKLAGATGGIGVTVVWILLALTLIAGMFWMGITGNRLCCDQHSLIMSILTTTDKSK